MKLFEVLNLHLFRKPVFRYSCFKPEFIGGTTYEILIYSPPGIPTMSLKTSSGYGVFRSRTTLLIDFETTREVTEALGALLPRLSSNPVEIIEGRTICQSLTEYNFQAIRKNDETWFRVFHRSARRWGHAYPISLLEGLEPEMGGIY